MKRYALPTIFALVVLALSLRHTEWLGWRHSYESLGDQYLGYAASLVRGEGYKGCPDGGYLQCEPNRLAYRLPVYPLFLAGGLLAFGQDDPLPPLRMTQSLLLAGAVYLTVGLAARLAGTFAAFITGLAGTAAALFMLRYAALLHSETLFIALMAVLVWLLVFRRRAFIIGVWIGVLFLTRGTLLFTAPLLALLIPWRLWPRLVAGVALVLLPWVARNALVLGEFIPFTTNSGAVLYGANHADAWERDPGMWENPEEMSGWEPFATLGEVEQDRALTQAALDFLRTQPPGRLAEIALAKLRTLAR